jgi:hypothetical protein
MRSSTSFITLAAWALAAALVVLRSRGVNGKQEQYKTVKTAADFAAAVGPASPENLVDIQAHLDLRHTHLVGALVNSTYWLVRPRSLGSQAMPDADCITAR